jgi:hypothetical protein
MDEGPMFTFKCPKLVFPSKNVSFQEMLFELVEKIK